MGTARDREWGSTSCPACTCRVSKCNDACDMVFSSLMVTLVIDRSQLVYRQLNGSGIGEVVVHGTAGLHHLEPAIEGGLIGVAVHLQVHPYLLKTGALFKALPQKAGGIQIARHLNRQLVNRHAHFLCHEVSHHIQTTGITGQNIFYGIESCIAAAQLNRLVHYYAELPCIDRKSVV